MARSYCVYFFFSRRAFSLFSDAITEEKFRLILMSNQGSLDRNTNDMIRSQQEIPLSWSFSKSIESFSGSQTRFFT